MYARFFCSPIYRGVQMSVIALMCCALPINSSRHEKPTFVPLRGFSRQVGTSLFQETSLIRCFGNMIKKVQYHSGFIFVNLNIILC
jgi:hypothetical protein